MSAFVDSTPTAGFRLPASSPDGWLRQWCAPVYRRVRRMADRRLHSWRRSRAVRRIESLPTVRHVLILCHGNVCRSPFAAELLRTLAPVRVESAGFIGPGRTVPPSAAEAAATRSVDLAGHRSQLVTRAQLTTADLVIVMDAAQARATRRLHATAARAIVLLGDLDPDVPDTRAIVDPWARSPEMFGQVYDRIERCCRELARIVSQRAAP